MPVHFDTLPPPLPPETADHAVQITTADRQWLEQLGLTWPAAHEEADWLAGVNAQVEWGSIHIEDAMQADPETTAQVLSAREQFLDLLPAISQTTRASMQREWPCNMPLDTIIGAQRYLFTVGVNVPKVVNDSFTILGYSAENLKTTVHVLETWDIVAAAVINDTPRILTYAADSLSQKLANLAAYGINVAKLVTAFPRILSSSPYDVRLKLDMLAQRGVNPAKALAAYPKLLRFSARALEERMTNLEAVGFDVGRLVNGQPQALSHAPETLQVKKNNLEAKGINAQSVIQTNPKILGYALPSLNAKLRVLYGAGRAWRIPDYRSAVNRLLEAQPMLLDYSPKRMKLLIRIASLTLPKTGEIASADVKAVTASSLEATLAAYLEKGTEMGHPADLARFARAYHRFGKPACRQIIDTHPADPIVQLYNRWYSGTTIPDDPIS